MTDWELEKRYHPENFEVINEEEQEEPCETE